eukprot:GHVQ01017055.1.p1 GENE.GHVQ01017055.1~~GHVQ01017055.1.p1  ORF type:complete len:295 (+),score=78.69 GHVQ01017055.1:1481-2365(+)
MSSPNYIHVSKQPPPTPPQQTLSAVGATPLPTPPHSQSPVDQTREPLSDHTPLLPGPRLSAPPPLSSSCKDLGYGSMGSLLEMFLAKRSRAARSPTPTASPSTPLPLSPRPFNEQSEACSAHARVGTTANSSSNSSSTSGNCSSSTSTSGNCSSSTSTSGNCSSSTSTNSSSNNCSSSYSSSNIKSIQPSQTKLGLSELPTLPSTKCIDSFTSPAPHISLPDTFMPPSASSPTSSPSPVSPSSLRPSPLHAIPLLAPAEPPSGSGGVSLSWSVGLGGVRFGSVTGGVGVSWEGG